MNPRCSICPRINQPIPPDGPTPCQVLLIGEGPNKSEDKQGIPFCGPSGRELNEFYLPRAGLFRDDVGVTNATHCSFRGYRNPSLDEARACSDHHLPIELEQFKPQVIVAMGAIACSLFTPKPNLELQHGKPFIGRLYNWIGPVLPLYHPAGGIHDSKLMIQLQRDFPALKLVLSGWEEFETHEYDGESRLITTTQELNLELSLCDRYLFAMDTETDAQGPDLDPLNDPPYCMSFSGRKGFGGVIMVDNHPVLEMLSDWLNRWLPQILLHNSLFDKPVLRRLGIDFPWSRVRDTMVDAYTTAWMPQGLKQLAYRHLGIEMNDYSDLVRSPSAEQGLKYLYRLSRESGIPQPYLQPRQWTLPRKANSAFTACADGKADPQDRWMEWPELDHQAAEDRLGRFPYRSIRYADLDKVIKYSGEDSAVLWELAPVLSIEMANIRKDARA